MQMHGGKFKQYKWADFAVSGCLKFGFLVAIRKTRRTTVGEIKFQRSCSDKSSSNFKSICHLQQERITNK